MAEQVTCKCKDDPWIFVDAGTIIEALSAGRRLEAPERGWVRYEDRGNSPTPWHMWMGEDGEILFCDCCGTGLNANGTTQARVDVVTSAHDATIEEGLRQYGEFAQGLMAAAKNGIDNNLDEVTLDIAGFAAIAERIGQLVKDCRRLYEERNAALSGGLGTVPVAALEWLSDKLAECSSEGFAGPYCPHGHPEDDCIHTDFKAQIIAGDWSGGDGSDERCVACWIAAALGLAQASADAGAGEERGDDE